ncbi:hypothetical protein [Hoeflea sp.]|uniref:hypothetical protein n=1 Tax=Hoeflea sp. TaxID=1940281 RepID=UPI003A8DD180
MTEIHGSKDCGNSPKNTFVQKIAIALESGEAKLENFSEDVIWERSAEVQVTGRSALAKALAAQPTPAVITVDHAISHGKAGAASGEVTLANGEGRRFSHVLDFTNAKANCVSRIRSYV